MPLFRRSRRDSVREVESPSIDVPTELTDFIRAVSTVGDKDDPTYRAAVEALRGRDDLARRAAELVAMPALEPDQSLRQCLTLAIGAIGGTAAVDALTGIADRRVERRSDPAELSSAVAHETVRAIAVDQLAMLARTGTPEALEALMTVGGDSRTVRAIALAALRDADTARFDEAARSLSDPFRELADVAYADVRAVMQPDPRRQLLDDERAAPVATPLDEGRRAAPGQPAHTGAPRAGSAPADG